MNTAELCIAMLNSNRSSEILRLLQHPALPTALQRALRGGIPRWSTLNTAMCACFGADYANSTEYTLATRAKEWLQLADSFENPSDQDAAAVCLAIAIASQRPPHHCADYYLAIEKLQAWCTHQHDDAARRLATDIGTISKRNLRPSQQPLPRLNSAATLRARINAGQIMVKCVSQQLKHINFLLQQLRDPIHNRPRIAHGLDRGFRFNPQSQLMEYRFTPPRPGRDISDGDYPDDTPLPHRYAEVPLKKTAMSLAAPDGLMSLFDHTNTVGFLFDLSRCNTKQERYVFLHNMRTRDRGWLGHQTQAAYCYRENITTIAALHRKQVRDHQSGSRKQTHTEQLIAPTKQALVGITATADTPQDRICAQLIADYIRHRLGLDLPVFIMTGESSICDYSQRHFYRDISTHPGFALIQACCYHSDSGVEHALMYPSLISDHDIRNAFNAALNNRNHFAVNALLSIPLTIRFDNYDIDSNVSWIEAVIRHFPKHLRHFLALGANPNYTATDPSNNSPLDVAIECAQADSILALLAHGAKTQRYSLTAHCLMACSKNRDDITAILLPHAIAQGESIPALISALGINNFIKQLDAATLTESLPCLSAINDCAVDQLLLASAETTAKLAECLLSQHIAPNSNWTYLIAKHMPYSEAFRTCTTAGSNLHAAFDLAVAQHDGTSADVLIGAGVTPTLSINNALHLTHSKQLPLWQRHFAPFSDTALQLLKTALQQPYRHCLNALLQTLCKPTSPSNQQCIVDKLLQHQSAPNKISTIATLLECGFYGHFESAEDWLAQLAQTQTTQFMLDLFKNSVIDPTHRNVIIKAMLADALGTQTPCSRDSIQRICTHFPQVITAYEFDTIISMGAIERSPETLQQFFSHSHIPALQQLHTEIDRSMATADKALIYPALLDYARKHGLNKAFALNHHGSACLVHIAKTLAQTGCSQAAKHAFASLCQNWIERLPLHQLTLLKPLLNKNPEQNILCRHYGLWRLSYPSSYNTIKECLAARQRTAVEPTPSSVTQPFCTL